MVGVDIGETHVQVGLFDCTLDTLDTATYPLASTKLDPAQVAELVIKGIDEVTADIDPAGLLGIGVGVPGAVQSDGLVHAPTLQWSGVPLVSMLCPSVSAPLYVDNCARTLGQAEMWRGAGRDARRAVIALLGVGVGAVVADSYSNATSTTSEWGIQLFRSAVRSAAAALAAASRLTSAPKQSSRATALTPQQIPSPRWLSLWPPPTRPRRARSRKRPNIWASASRTW